jgi:anti-repressor protein
MNELKTFNFDTQTVSARELHEQLNIETPFHKWFPRMCEYGFTEGTDFWTKMSESTGGRPATEYEVSIDMAKEICMIQRTPEGKRVREYLIQLERAWNTPELVMARGLQASQKLLEESQQKIKLLTAENERMKPKEIFADAVTASDTSILVRDLAKILRQNGIEIGEKRLYKWLRENGYIIKHSTQPTQKAMEMGLFEVIERTTQRADLPPIVTSTTKVTGKGQQYFINKFLGGAA